MDPYLGMDNFWDLSQNPATFSTLGEDDFLALLQKQFPTNNPFDIPPPDGVDPLNLNVLPVQNPTPPSTDSSPSPPSTNQDSIMPRRQSGAYDTTPPAGSENGDDPTLKRKASDEDMTDEPTSKDMRGDSLGRKPSSGPHRRKSTGNPHQDEIRLLKRKEQNRAAQRAFRERKEKHVRDLEDKVAALEAKNQAAESENDNLRDLLSRLQSENMALKQSAFTFQVPKSNTNAPSPFQSQPSVGSPPHMAQQQPQQLQQYDFNFGSLIPFDPASLNMLDEPTATDGAMNMDFGLGQPNGLSPYKTIASNPMYMSFAEPTPYDLTPPPVHPIMQMQSPAPSSSESAASPIDQALRMTPFDWKSNSPPSAATATNGGNVDSMDHLFSVGFNGAQSPVDFSALLRSPPSSVSPVSHRSNSSPLSPASPSSSTSVNNPSSPLSSQPLNGFAAHPPGQSTDGCPRTKEDVSKMIQAQGSSSFVQDPPAAMRTQSAPFFQNGNNANGAGACGDGPGDACARLTKDVLMTNVSGQGGPDESVGPNGGFVRKTGDGSMVMCKGSSFPKTEKNERNIEVLTAWRSITQNPQFKNVDINELCSEFTKKARCDGTKVVLEPEGVSDIIQSLANRK